MGKNTSPEQCLFSACEGITWHSIHWQQLVLLWLREDAILILRKALRRAIWLHNQHCYARMDRYLHLTNIKRSYGFAQTEAKSLADLLQNLICTWASDCCLCDMYGRWYATRVNQGGLSCDHPDQLRI